MAARPAPRRARRRRDDEEVHGGNLLRVVTQEGRASVLLGQMFQHGVAGFLGLGEYLEGRPADLDRATTLMNWTPRR